MIFPLNSESMLPHLPGCRGSEPTIHDEFGAGNVGGLVGGEEQEAALATSQASPIRPIGTHLSRSLTKPSMPPWVPGIVYVHHGSVDMAWQNRIGTNAFGGVLDGKCTVNARMPPLLAA